jgi:hypothetical protein
MKEKSTHIIYGLFDPNSGELRYIGYTSDKSKRYYAHHKYVKGYDHKSNWIKSLLKNNQKAELIVLETYETAKELPQAEVEMIEYYKFVGARLTNATSGGEGLGINLSIETRQKMSAAKKGQPSPNKGNKYSEERCREMSQVRLGHATSEKQKIKISKALKKISVEEEQKIIELYATGNYSHRSLAKLFSHNRETIAAILNSKVRVRKRKTKSRFLT